MIYLSSGDLLCAYELPIKPMTAPRPRFSRVGHAYNPKKYAAYLDTLKYLIQSKHAGIIFAEPLILDVDFFFMDRHHRDIDNLHKPVMDACSGIIYKNDSIIQAVVAKKFFADFSAIRLAFYALKPYNISNDSFKG